MSGHHIIIAGAGGIIGRRLIETLTHRPPRNGGRPPRITVLTRREGGTWPAGVTPLLWSPSAARDGDDATLDRLAWAMEGANALVNLAGSSIAAGRLDDAHLQRVTTSRQEATATLLAAAHRATTPPQAWLQGAAVGIYGDRGDEVLRESSPIGDPTRDLLTPTGSAWEGAADPAAKFSRLVVVRIGVVFDRDAEAWRKLLLPIRLFVGGPLGSGRQWLPWISGRDTARAIVWLLERDSAAGVYNLAAPGSLRQIEVARLVARALRRPAIIPAPAFALRWILGRLADALLLSSQRVVPERLLAEGFSFLDAELADALPELL
jgi:uncharacterized protein (TIGR01777 family)